MPRVRYVPVQDSTRVRDVRVAAEAAAAGAGLDERRTAAVSLVATELATNLVKHAHGGQVVIEVVDAAVPREPAARSVQITAIDHGPGMADVAGAMRDGFSTTGSLGAGLGTCRRLSDDFGLHSVRGRGTVAVARIAGAAPAAGVSPGPGVRAGGVNIPFAAAEESGDDWAWVRSGDLYTLMLADGLGHGAAACLASAAAVS
ncbi:anti-sigma regulatory factor, partial [Streptomyces thermospinosisporus]|uniref:anti-sigma regulatory factor n=1 Tax=Streptomyces thermospinosisporus TaxID=161482 RepID=UPI0031D4E39B